MNRTPDHRIPHALLPSFALALSLLSSTAHAEPEEYTLPAIVGVGDRVIRDETSRSFISRKEIDTSAARTVGELLKRTAGVDFGANYSGSAYAYLRGSPSSQTLVFIDGVRANDPSDPSRAFDFSNLDLAQIESIEILKGPHSVEFGQGAGGGVILIQTRRLEKRGMSFRGEAGSRESYRASLLAGTPIARQYSLEMNLTHDETEGFSFNRTPLGDLDGRSINAATLRLRANPSESLEITGVSGWEYSRQEIDTLTDDPNARTATRTFRNAVSLRATPAPNVALHLDVTRLNVRRFYEDPINSPTDFAVDSLYRGTNDSVDVTLRTQPLPPLEFAVGTNFQREAFEYASWTASESRSQTRVAGAYAQALVQLSDHLSAEVGIRHDRPEDLASQTIYQFGLEEELGPAITGHARYGTAYRLPSLSQRFDPQFGNPNLSTETSRSIEAGLSGALLKELTWSSTAFLQHYENLIASSGPPNFIPVNTDRAKIQGIEGSLNYRRGSLAWIPHATYLRATDRSTGLELPKRSRWKGGLIFQWESTDRVMDQWLLEAEALAKSSRRDLSSGPARAGGYALFSAALTYRRSENLQVFLRIENVLDRAYEENIGYGTPGRGFFGGLRVML